MKKKKDAKESYRQMMESINPKSEYFKPFKITLRKDETLKRVSIRLLPTYEDKYLKFDGEELNLVVLAKRYWDSFNLKKKGLKAFDKPVLSSKSFFLTGEASEQDEIISRIFDLSNLAESEDDRRLFLSLLPNDVHYSVALVDDEVVIWEYPKSIWEMINEFNGQIIDEAEEGEEIHLINDVRKGRNLTVKLEKKGGNWDYIVTMASKESDAFPDMSDEEVDEILRSVPKIEENFDIVDDEYLNGKFDKFLELIGGDFESETQDDEDEDDVIEVSKEEVESKKRTSSDIISKLKGNKK